VDDRIIAVGFLTQHDLNVLGRGFTRHFQVDHEDVFADLLAKLDQVEATPDAGGVRLTPGKRS
jgi:hypothetical protein